MHGADNLVRHFPTPGHNTEGRHLLYDTLDSIELIAPYNDLLIGVQCLQSI